MSGPAPLWPATRIVTVCRDWERRYGVPPKAAQWRHGNEEHPSDTTVLRVFGGWNTMLAAAGFRTHPPHSATVWPNHRIVAACRSFVEEHGRPPLYREWMIATPVTPNAATVQRVFGTWNRMLAEAGFVGRPAAPPSRWCRGTIAEAMLDFVGRHGRWPTGRDWEVGGDHPMRSTVLSVFGSWTAAKRYAGWDGVRRRNVSKSGPGVLVESASPLIPGVTDGERSRPGRYIPQTAAEAA